MGCAGVGALSLWPSRRMASKLNEARNTNTRNNDARALRRDWEYWPLYPCDSILFFTTLRTSNSAGLRLPGTPKLRGMLQDPGAESQENYLIKDSDDAMRRKTAEINALGR